MKLLDNLREYIYKMKNKKQLILLETPKNTYKNLIKSDEINNIIEGIPPNLTETEKAYYIYLELGKILNENPNFVFNDVYVKAELYNDVIKEDFRGICMSISDLYLAILRDKRIGIKGSLVKKFPDSPITHVDAVLNLDGKNYISNLINDLSRIKTSMKVNGFGFNLTRPTGTSFLDEENIMYYEKLQKQFGMIHTLSRNEIEKMDKKFGYSTLKLKDEDRGMYTEDVIQQLGIELNNPVLFKEYVLHGQEVPEEDLLQHKLEYIFDNIDKITEYTNEMKYLEQIRYYLYIARKVLSPEEAKRITAYAVTKGENNKSNVFSVLKVLPKDKEKKKEKSYYVYSADDGKYIKKTQEEIMNFFSNDDTKIVGIRDKYRHIDNEDVWEK